MIDQYAERWALITGASSGIGKEFAQFLAARGMHLILTARRENLLNELAEDLDRRHGTQSVVFAEDLSAQDVPQKLLAEIQSRNIEIELLINNAGFSVVNDIANTDTDSVLKMVDLNIRALTELSYRVLPEMMKRGHGSIINVASVAGFQPVAYMGGYAASKAYVLHLTEALWAEAKDAGVTVTAICPGTTRTNFFDVAGVPNWLKKNASQSPEQVVQASIKAMEKGRQYWVSGWKNYLLSLLVRIAPRKKVILESMKYFRPASKK